MGIPFLGLNGGPEFKHSEAFPLLKGSCSRGISGDYDGMEFPIPELEDVSTFPRLLIELARRGWTEKELRKITSENFLRVFEEVEERANELKKNARRATVR